MGLISRKANVKWNKKQKKYYESLGYIYTKLGDEFEVKVEDLTKGSSVKVECICDNCGKILPSWTYQQYNKYKKENGETYCSKCGTLLFGKEKSRKTKLSKSKSFEQWCIENNRQDILDRWDYELNDCLPSEISYGVRKKCWFKCDKHEEHKSELKSIVDFTNGCEGSIECKQCKSIAQYILDSFPDKKLEEVWDYEKNGDLDPWSINRGSHIKIWIICQEKEYHGSYEIKCYSFIRGSRCSYCCNYHGKVHPLDSLKQYIINNYGEEFFNIIWSEKNKVDPTTIAPNSLIECWWNCPDIKHKPFKRSCHHSFASEYRCIECVQERKESLIEEKTRLYLEELGYEVLTEYKCSIIPKNPKKEGKNNSMPFDNEILLENGKHLIIEVHGIQHYEIDGYYNKTKEDLEYQQYKDNYKKEQCLKLDYEYLEIPYTAFDKSENYKQIIDNKIKNLLTNDNK